MLLKALPLGYVQITVVVLTIAKVGLEISRVEEKREEESFLVS